MTRELEYHDEALDDIYQLNDYIEDKCKAPLTARRYLEGMEKSVLWLQENADIFPDCPRVVFTDGISHQKAELRKDDSPL